MFERISTANQPKANTDKYAGAYEGKPAGNLATIHEGRDFQNLVLANIAAYRKTPTFIKSCGLLAQIMVNGNETYRSIEELLNDRFDVNKPIDLYLEIEQGANRPTGDDIGDETLDPAGTVGQVMFNVRKSIDAYLADESEHKANSWTGFFQQVDRSAAVGTAGGIANVVNAEIAANAAANEADAKKKGK